MDLDSVSFEEYSIVFQSATDVATVYTPGLQIKSHYEDATSTVYDLFARDVFTFDPQLRTHQRVYIQLTGPLSFTKTNSTGALMITRRVRYIGLSVRTTDGVTHSFKISVADSNKLEQTLQEVSVKSEAMFGKLPKPVVTRPRKPSYDETKANGDLGDTAYEP